MSDERAKLEANISAAEAALERAHVVFESNMPDVSHRIAIGDAAIWLRKTRAALVAFDEANGVGAAQ